MFKIAEAISGQITPVIKEFDIATSTAVRVGSVLKLSAGKVVQAAAGDAILGVAAVEHGSTKDMFNQYSGTGKIVAYCDPDQIFEAPIKELTATGGSATTVTYSGSITANDLNGCFIQDEDGKVTAITGSGISSGTITLTFASGAVKAGESGNKYKVYGFVGNTNGKVVGTALDEFAVDSTASAAVFVVLENKFDKGTCIVKPIKHQLACGR